MALQLDGALVKTARADGQALSRAAHSEEEIKLLVAHGARLDVESKPAAKFGYDLTAASDGDFKMCGALHAIELMKVVRRYAKLDQPPDFSVGLRRIDAQALTW